MRHTLWAWTVLSFIGGFLALYSIVLCAAVKGVS